MTRPFVLVHGAWHGGWCWDRLTPLLRAAGAKSFAPTCTGLSERSLVSDKVGLKTFVDDIAGLLETENLTDVVLVGHSFAGLVISGVVDLWPERISHLVYLDAAIVPSGQSAFDLLTPDVVVARRQAARVFSGGLTMPAPPAAAFGVVAPEDARWLEARLTPHPIKSYEDKLQLAHPLGNGRPKTYIACIAPAYAATAPVRAWVRAQEDWHYRELATGRDAMITAPQALADGLLCFDGGRRL